MPTPSKTLGDLVKRVHFQIAGTATVDPLLKTEIKQAIGFTLHDLINKIDHPAFRASQSILTEAGTADYPLPDDFVRLIDPGVVHDSSPYEPICFYEQQEYDAGGGRLAFSSQGRPRFYTLRGRRWGLAQTAWTGEQVIRFVPTPDDAYVIDFWFFALPDDLASLNDSAEIDQRFPRYAIQGLFHGALTHFSQYLTPDQVAFHQAKYVEASRDLARNAKAVVGRRNKKRPYRPQTSMFEAPVDDLAGSSDLIA